MKEEIEFFSHFRHHGTALDIVGMLSMSRSVPSMSSMMALVNFETYYSFGLKRIRDIDINIFITKIEESSIARKSDCLTIEISSNFVIVNILQVMIQINYND